MSLKLPHTILRATVAVGLVAAALAPASASAELYVIRGKKGVVTFTSRKPREGTQFQVFKAKPVSFSYYRVRGRWSPQARVSIYDPLIRKAAVDQNLDPTLVKAVVHVESAFNSTARSNKGAMGLMQLMPGTAKRFGVQNAYHPEQNLRGGTAYLQWLLRRYNGNVRLALAAYNAGEQAVDRYGGVPPYNETQEYVRRVTETHRVYRCGGKNSRQC